MKCPKCGHDTKYHYHGVGGDEFFIARSKAGRKPEPGRQFLVKVRVFSEDEKTIILSLTPRARVEAMIERAKQTQ